MRKVLFIYTIVVLLVILLALLSSPAFIFKNNSYFSKYNGGPLDNTSRGESIAYSVIKAIGYNISIGDNTSHGYDGVIVLDARRDDSLAAKTLIDLARNSTKHYLIVAGDPLLIENIEKQLKINASVPISLKKGLYLLLNRKGEVIWFTRTDTGINFTLPSTGLRLLAYTFPGGIPLVYSLNKSFTGGIKIILYVEGKSDFKDFSNKAVSLGALYNLSVNKILSELLNESGAKPGDTLLVPGEGIGYARVPRNNTVSQVIMRFNIRRIVASAVTAFLEAEKSLIKLFSGILFFPILLILLMISYISGRKIVVPLAERSGEDTILERHKPIQELSRSAAFIEIQRIIKSGKIDKSSAKKIIKIIYNIINDKLKEKYGVSLKEALSNERILEEIALVSGVSLNYVYDNLSRLTLIYEKKIIKNKILPFVNIRKEALRLYNSLSPILEGLGFKVKGKRGAEYV